VKAEVVLQRATALCDLGRWDDAVALLATLLATDPHHGEGHCLMAQALCGKDDFGLALKSSLAAIAENPEEEWPHRLAGLALSGLGRHREAVAMARTAVTLAPETAQCHMMLANVLAACGSSLEEARVAADRAVCLAPQEAECYGSVGRVAARAGRTEDAIAAFQQVLSIDPDSRVAHNELARLQLQRKRFATAGSLSRVATGFAAAVRADPRAAVSRGNVDVVLIAFLGRVQLSVYTVAWVSFVAYVVRTGRDDSVFRLVPALLLIYPVAFALRFLSGLEPWLRGYVLQRLRSRLAVLAVLLNVLAAVGILVGLTFRQLSGVALISAAGCALLSTTPLRAWRRELPGTVPKRHQQRPVIDKRHPHPPVVDNLPVVKWEKPVPTRPAVDDFDANGLLDSVVPGEDGH
jgi:Flp pilus assembly protein TadD